MSLGSFCDNKCTAIEPSHRPSAQDIYQETKHNSNHVFPSLCQPAAISERFQVLLLELEGDSQNRCSEDRSSPGQDVTPLIQRHQRT